MTPRQCPFSRYLLGMSLHPPFISDAGEQIRVVPEGGGETRVIPRYGVWVFDRSRRKYQVAECSDDPDALTAKFGVTAPVQVLPKTDP